MNIEAVMGMMQPTDVFFYIFSFLAIAFALKVVLSSNPISSAFSLVMVLFCIAADFVLMHAHFLAALQVLVYAGAVMVLFVFVIMLLNADAKNTDQSKGRVFQFITATVCVALFAMFAWSLDHGQIASATAGLSVEKIDQLGGNVQAVSELMFSDYILPFELTSVLLLVGIAGSVALAKRNLDVK